MVKSKNSGFFAEWEDALKPTFLFLIATTFLAFILTGIFNNFPSEQANAQVFITLGILSVLLIVIESMMEKVNLFRTTGFGEKVFLPIIVGVGVGLFLRLSGQVVIGTPFASIVSIDLLLGFVYVVVCAPLIEEFAFRGVVQPLLTGLFNDYVRLPLIASGVMALFVQAGLFAWFHWRVFGGEPALLASSFLFAVIVTIGNYAFKSLGFGYGVHFTNNLLAWFVLSGFF